MFLKVGHGIKSEICHAVLQYSKANNKYMKDYYENEDFLYVFFNKCA